MIPVHSKNQIISLPILGEIFLCIVNDMVCPNRACHVHVPRAAHGSDFSPERFGNLHGERPHATRRAVNQNPLAWLNLSFIAKTLQGDECRLRDGCCFRKRYIGRFQDQSIFRNRDIFSKTAKTTLDCIPEDLITRLKLCDVSANHCNPPRYVSSKDPVFWLEKPIAHQTHQERFRSQKMPVTRIDGCRMHFYQYFIVLGSRFCYLFELKNIRSEERRVGK